MNIYVHNNRNKALCTQIIVISVIDLVSKEIRQHLVFRFLKMSFSVFLIITFISLIRVIIVQDTSPSTSKSVP